MSEATQKDEFESIDPQGAVATFCGKDLTIKPLKVGQLPAFARALRKVDAAVFDDFESADAGKILALIADFGEPIIEAVSIATGVPISEVNEADVDDLVLVALKVVRVNADFFGRRLIPALTAAKEQAPKFGAGPTASKP